MIKDTVITRWTWGQSPAPPPNKKTFKKKTFKEKTFKKNFRGKIFSIKPHRILKKYGGDTDFDIVAKEYCLPGLDTAD